MNTERNETYWCFNFRTRRLGVLIDLKIADDADGVRITDIQQTR